MTTTDPIVLSGGDWFGLDEQRRITALDRVIKHHAGEGTRVQLNDIGDVIDEATQVEYYLRGDNEPTIAAPEPTVLAPDHDRVRAPFEGINRDALHNEVRDLIATLEKAHSLLARGRLARQVGDPIGDLDTTTEGGKARVQWAAERDNTTAQIAVVVNQLRNALRGGRR